MRQLSRASVADRRSSTPSASRRVGTVALGLALASAAVALPLAPAPAAARSAPRVVINEVLYDAAGTDTGQEWIELFNAGAEVVDLADWRLERAGTAFAPVHTFARGTTLSPQSFLLIGESSIEDADVTATLTFQNGGSATDGIRLVDDDDEVVDVLLYDNPNTNALPDETGASGVSFAPDSVEGRSLGRFPDGVDTNASGADFRELANLTPGQPNIQDLPTASPTLSLPVAALPAGVVVNEVLPNPVGNDAAGEFIELFNPTSAPVDLGGALLDDGEGGSSPYSVPAGAALPPGSFRVFPQGETKIALNNNGDTARLLGADGTVVSVLTYGVVPREGAAWARRDDGSAAWTVTATPGAPNAFTSLPTDQDDEAESGDGSLASARERKRASGATTPSPTPSASPTARRVTLADARALPWHARVVVSGTVSVPSNVLGRGIFYLADGGVGLQVYVQGGDPPMLAMGERLRVEGVIGSADNETRLRARPTEIQRIGRGGAPSPEEVGTGDVGPALAGALVRVRGTVVRLSGGGTVWVDDGSGPLRVVVKKTTGFERPALRRGQHVTVVGIVSLAGEGTRLLPRFREDYVGGIVAAAEQERPAVPPPATASDEAERAVVAAEAAGEQEDNAAEEAVVEVDDTPFPTAAPSAGESRDLELPARRLPVGALLSWGVAAAVGIIHLLTKRS